jgi:hypothetical protein
MTSARSLILTTSLHRIQRCAPSSASTISLSMSKDARGLPSPHHIPALRPTMCPSPMRPRPHLASAHRPRCPANTQASDLARRPPHPAKAQVSTWSMMAVMGRPVPVLLRPAISILGQARTAVGRMLDPLLFIAIASRRLLPHSTGWLHLSVPIYIHNLVQMCVEVATPSLAEHLWERGSRLLY